MIRLLFSSLWHYRRIHLGVLLAAALASAVLTGSLLVGDSVDGTLKMVALQRLGGIHYALQVPQRFVSDSLPARMGPDTAGLLQLRGMALSEAEQINKVQVIGCESPFWRFCERSLDLAAEEVALNRRLADALQLREGDEVSLRIENPGLLPLDAPLSAQDADRTVRGRFAVRRILGDDELGRFGLSASQTAPFNAFVNREWLQERTGRSGQINLIVAGEQDPSDAFSETWTPEDFGLRFVQRGSVVQLETDGIYLDPESARAALSISGAAGSLTYLVNSLSAGEFSTPYSFVLAIDRAGLADDEILINRWLADELRVRDGDMIRMRYYELLPSGKFEERERKFTVKETLEMETLEAERDLAPPFPGLTDVDRCADWDVGLPMDEDVLEDEANEAYWDAWRQTPKAIVSLRAGQQMWSNRFGALTSVRWAAGEDAETAFRSAYQPEASGFRFLPVREQALAAVDQAMDFGQLFAGMSFFLVLSALLLCGMVFVFGIQTRAGEMGALLSTGWPVRKVRFMQMAEGGLVALAGAVPGAMLGMGYTKLLIFGLAHGWGGAVANTSIHFFAETQTILIGGVSAFLCALVAMMIAIRRQARRPVRELLHGTFAEEFDPSAVVPVRKPSRLIGAASAILALAAVGVVVFSLVGDGRNLATGFFAAGALLLAAGVCGCSILLRRLGRDAARLSLGGLAYRNAGRRRGRSLAVIGLMASGCFLVFSVSSMQENVAAHADEPGSGTGGFAWFGESTLGIREGFDGVNIRVRDGDDASCLNLNRAQSPRLLGVDPAALSVRQAFLRGDDIWERLNLALPDGTVPGLVGDSDTAMWGLEASTGIEKGDVLNYVDDHGNSFKVKLVGALPMRLSIFQGTVLISEKHFVERFPSESGWRMFLLDQRPDTKIHERLGFDVVPSVERLRDFYAVESTYLGMFLVLGALGLVVGSLGLGMVVLRNVQDRRMETALLRAVGYSGKTLSRLLLKEHGWLLAAGLGLGTVAAMVAMVPALFITRTEVAPGLMLLTVLGVVGCAWGCMALAVRMSLSAQSLDDLREE